ncbi:hypothetical protein Tco_1131508, partial [Tanacetum coccineum]
CKDDCKSTSGGLQFLGGKLVSWSSKKQDCTAMSTAEAKYVSMTEYQLADLFTEALPKERFEYLVHRIESKILTNIIKNIPVRFAWLLLQSFMVLYDTKKKGFMAYFEEEDQAMAQIMQMLYCFVNNIHVDYAELLWEGLYYSLHHPTSLIPYLRFTKIIVSHYMTIFPDISRRARDMYHNLQDDDIMKNIFNSGRHKNKVGMQIPAWMITDEMKKNRAFRMYTEVVWDRCSSDSVTAD